MADVCRAILAQVSHTPFCDKNCTIKHHELIGALFAVNILSVSKPGSCYLFNDTVRKTIATGWEKNSEVPDQDPELQCPLVHLACAFARHKALELLINMGFDPIVRLRNTGQTGLHVAVRHVYKTGAWSENRNNKAAKMKPKSRTVAFMKILSTLTNKAPLILRMKDNNWDTAFHTAANELANITQTEAHRADRTDRTDNYYHPKNRRSDVVSCRKQHFEQCLKALVTTLGELEENRFLSTEDVFYILCSRNKAKQTVLDILSQYNCGESESYEMFNDFVEKTRTKLFPMRVSGKRRQLHLGTGKEGLLVGDVLPPDTSEVHVVFGNASCPSLIPNTTTADTMQEHNIPSGTAIVHLPSTCVATGDATSDSGKSKSLKARIVSGNHRVPKISAEKRRAALERSRASFLSRRSRCTNTEIQQEIMDEEPPRKKQAKKSRKGGQEPTCEDNVDELRERIDVRVICPDPNKLDRGLSEQIDRNTTQTNSNCQVDVDMDDSTTGIVELTNQFQDANEATRVLEKECFELEQERLERLARLREKQEQITLLQAEVQELEKQATNLAVSKLKAEKHWKEAQRHQESLRSKLKSIEKPSDKIS